MTNRQMKETLTSLLLDLSVLAGDKIVPSKPYPLDTWQEVARAASLHASRLADALEQARLGNHEMFIVFPSPADCLEEVKETKL